MMPNKNQAPSGRAAVSLANGEKSKTGGRFVTVTFDALMPLRPQLLSAKAAVTDHTLRWLREHPEDRPLRVAKRKNRVFYVECARIDVMLRDGVPRDVIQRKLWPTADRELQRRRFNYRVARWRKLVDRHLELAATDQTVL
jgi:hypothetical protein